MIENDDNSDDEDGEQQIELPPEFLTMADSRVANKAAALATLTNLINNMPREFVGPHMHNIMSTVTQMLSNVGSRAEST
ncbi:hypothetical protein HW132_35005 [Brasilonema sp. CT11]|nr:hypothetical protein [Brasilonema sp. CT11]